MNKKILRLAIPNILSNLSIPLLSSVDTAIIGHLDQVYYLGAIAIGGMIFNAIYWAFGFLRMGTTGLTAQASGKKDTADIAGTFARALIVAVASALFLIVFQSLISKIAFGLVNASENVELFAAEYFNIRIYAAPATLALYVFHGWFIGMQNAKYPMILAISVNLLNVFFNLIFIYQFGMKSDGVALGTVFAQYFGLVFAVLLMIRKYPEYLKLVSIKLIKDAAAFKNFFKLNLDIFIRTLSLIFVFSFFTARSAEYGDNVVAVNTILLQLWMIVSYGIDGFAYAAESLVGNYFGARDIFNLKKVIKYCFAWALGLGMLFSGVYYFFDRGILMIFTDKVGIIDLALVYFIWIVFSPVLNSICFIWDGVYIGATAGKAMRNSMIISSFAVFFPLFYISSSFIGNHALWLALSIFMISRGILLSLQVKKNVFNRIVAGEINHL